MKLLQELRGLADVTHRRPPPRQPGLFLIQLRSHVLETRQPRTKKVILVDMQGRLDIPYPVKITHIAAAQVEDSMPERQRLAAPASQF
jgi:hypothetical protein